MTTERRGMTNLWLIVIIPSVLVLKTDASVCEDGESEDAFLQCTFLHVTNQLYGVCLDKHDKVSSYSQ